MVGVEVGVMNRSRWCCVGIVALVFIAGLGALAEPCTITVQPGESIQEAIDAASPGDVICLAEGEWEENLVIEKSLTLRAAEIQPEPQAVITSAREGWPVILIRSEEPLEVTVQGLMITGASGPCFQLEPEPICAYGIYVHGKATATIEGNTISGNWNGIRMYDSSQATIENNVISGNNRHSIQMEDSSQVTIGGNTISDNRHGMRMSGSSQATIENNTISDNERDGIWMEDSSQATIEDNTVSDNRLSGIHSTSTEPVQGGGNRMSGNHPDLSGNVSARLRVPLVPETQETDLSFPGPYRTLQETIDAVAPGGTITVAPGIHQGGLTIWKPLILKGAERDEVVIEGAVSLIDEAQAVEIVGLMIANSPHHGLSLGGRAEATIESNAISDNGRGIWMGDSARATIASSTISDNRYGIEMRNSSQATIASNTISDNRDLGIRMRDSSQATIASNTISDNRYGMRMSGSSQATIENNTISDNRYGIEMRNSSQATTTNNTISDNHHGISMWASSEATIEDNTVSGNRYGIGMLDFSQGMIGGNIISDNRHGIWMQGFSQATIASNTISGSNEEGIFVWWSAQATIESNTINDNRDGITIRDSSQATISGNVIRSNERYGVALYESPCFDTRLVFTGYVTGEGNSGEGNLWGDYCPENLAFLFTEEGGELDQRE